MSDWTDLGFPSPQSGNYGFDRDVGILRTPFDSAWPRQKQGFKDKRETFNVWCMIGADQLAAAETFFAGDAYDWFTMPLRAGGAAGMADYTVRALGPCTFVPLGTSWWKAQFKIETQIAADAPDLTDPGYPTTEETCCLADDIQCCESEWVSPVACAEVVFFKEVSVGVWEELGVNPTIDGLGTDTVRIGVGVRFGARDPVEWGKADAGFGPADDDELSRSVYSIKQSHSNLLIYHAKLWSTSYGGYYRLYSEWGYGTAYATRIGTISVDGVDIQLLGAYYVAKDDSGNPASITVSGRVPGCYCDQEYSTSGTLTFSA